MNKQDLFNELTAYEGKFVQITNAQAMKTAHLHQLAHQLVKLEAIMPFNVNESVMCYVEHEGRTFRINGDDILLPIHQHDCERCTYLGRYDHYDLYFCDQMGNAPTVIYRWGSLPEQNSSGLSFARPGTPLGVAKIRAKKLNLLK